MARPARVEIQAPPGTYEYLHGLVDTRLGNDYTRRQVNVYQIPVGIYAEPPERALAADVTVRNMRSGEQNRYSISITRDEIIHAFSAYRSEGRRSTLQKVEPPILEVILKEVREAVRHQPKLKSA